MNVLTEADVHVHVHVSAGPRLSPSSFSYVRMRNKRVKKGGGGEPGDEATCKYKG